MNRKKHFVLFYDYLREEHLVKDVFLTPYYLGKQLDCKVSIVYLKSVGQQIQLPNTLRGVELIPIKLWGSGKKKLFFYYWYLATHARQIDYMMRFHLKFHTYLTVVLYKLINPHGKAYVKSDINPLDIDRWKTPSGIMFYIEKAFYNSVDVISCETCMAYNKLMMIESPYMDFRQKLVLMPNGFDEESYQSLEIEEKVFQKKSNIMITVGRLGTPQKNTIMLLKALEKVELGDWKFYLIGPIEDGFKSEIEGFYFRNPSKKGSVIFTGGIYDKKELWEYYNNSKVFVLTSKWEGYPIVFPEAKRFSCYLITTPVGAAEDGTEKETVGKIIPLNDENALVEILNNIVAGNQNVNVYRDYDKQQLSWLSVTNVITKRLLDLK